jgi:hypothetical protein
MGATLTRPEALTVPQARRRLAGTSCLSSDQVSELEKIVATFHAARPTGACVACGAMRWSEHTDGASESVWACSGCHRPATLTQDAWRAQQAARQATAAQPAAGPDPRAALSDAITRRQEAAATVGALETAATGALVALGVAQGRHADAVAGMRAAEQAAIDRAAAGLTGERAVRTDLPVDAARGKLRLCEDALQAARGARALIEDKLHYAKSSLANAHAAVSSAALRVIAAEEFEDTLTTAVVARADYLEAIGSLGWLIRNHCVPNGDVRPNQLVAEASETPPSRWPEAADAGARLAQRLAALEGTP